MGGAKAHLPTSAAGVVPDVDAATPFAGHERTLGSAASGAAILSMPLFSHCSRDRWVQAIVAALHKGASGVKVEICKALK